MPRSKTETQDLSRGAVLRRERAEARQPTVSPLQRECGWACDGPGSAQTVSDSAGSVTGGPHTQLPGEDVPAGLT
jgi:hypothetical protein